MKPTQVVNPKPTLKAWLIVHGGKLDGQSFRLRPRQGVITVGKDGKLADFVVDDQTVSSQHIRLRYENGHFVLTDLASLNGTWVNQKQVQVHRLQDDDVITIGSTTLVYKCIKPKVV